LGFKLNEQRDITDFWEEPQRGTDESKGLSEVGTQFHPDVNRKLRRTLQKISAYDVLTIRRTEVYDAYGPTR
jgi:hypothetical protein